MRKQELTPLREATPPKRFAEQEGIDSAYDEMRNFLPQTEIRCITHEQNGLLAKCLSDIAAQKSLPMAEIAHTVATWHSLAVKDCANCTKSTVDCRYREEPAKKSRWHF